MAESGEALPLPTGPGGTAQDGEGPPFWRPKQSQGTEELCVGGPETRGWGQWSVPIATVFFGVQALLMWFAVSGGHGP